MGIISDLKDNLANFSAKIFLEKALKNYGEVLNVHIDTGSKSISIELMLKGEDKAIIIDVNSYEVIKHPETAIKINSIKVSREWMEKLANDYFSGKKIYIPEKYSLIIKLIL